MSNEKRMLGNYEITQSIYIGDKEVVFGVDAEMDTQAFKGELGTMRDVLGEIQSDMYKSMEKNKPAKNKEQER